MDDNSNKIVFVSGARTPVGRFGGSLAGTENHVMGAHALRAALERGGVPAGAVDEVVIGCVGQVGGDAFLARRIALAAGARPESTAVTVNRLCGSGVEAIRSASLELRTGGSRIVVAGGSENMSRQPFMDFDARNGRRLGHHRLVDGTLSLVTDPFGDYPMGATAENVARRFGVSRRDQDEFAARSQSRAAAARDAGHLDAEIEPITVLERRKERVFDRDEHLRPETTVESLSGLRPAFAADGTVTAGNSSGINDAAAALVMTTEATAKEMGLPVMGELIACAKAGLEPEIMGYAPTLAVERVMERTGMSVTDMGWIELNEAFAAQAVAVMRALRLDPEVTNPLGGAIALGHPVGATGAILTIRTLVQLKRVGRELGLVTMCIGGGQGVAVVVRAR